MPGPLAGFRVLDLSAVVSGPLTGGLLADQGADVIKVERTNTGDIQRHVGSKANGFSGFFHVLNRGKRSLALDIGTTRGREVVHRLAKEVDVVIQNFRPGVVDRLGIGYQQLSASNPGLVYLSISGFGQTGPRSKDRAYDPIIQAYSGITQVQGRMHTENPDKPEQVNMLILDKLTAWTASQAITAALLSRSKTNAGQEIELSMLDTAIAFGWCDTAADIILHSPDEERPPVGASGYLWQFIDGWGTTMTLSQEEFIGLCKAYELEDVATDIRFNTLEARMQHRPELLKVQHTRFAEVAATLTVEQARKRLTANEVPFAKALKLSELANDPQVQHNQTFRQLEHPVAGMLTDARPAPRFSRTPASAGNPAPYVGEHSTEILQEAGYEQAAIDELFAGGIVS